MKHPDQSRDASSAESHTQTESRDELIERLLAKADLDYKCCGSHCSGVICTGGTVEDRD